jgi:hypothetical protein
MFFRPRIYKHKYDRDMIDHYVRRFYNRKTLIEMAERLGVKITYIKHRIHALNIAPYREDKIPVINKRPYKDYGKYNYAEEFEKAISHIKYVYGDPDFSFSEWADTYEGEATIFYLVKALGVPMFQCNYKPIQCRQRRGDMFI